MECGAKRRLNGTPCRAPAMTNGRCRIHGGKSPAAGPQHPNWKTGYYSKAVPDYIRERIKAGDSDPQVLSHRRDLALLDARLDKLVERLDEGGSTRLWMRLKAEWQAMLEAREAQDMTRLAKALDIIGEVINSGVDEEQAWRELRDVVKDRRDQATHEHKRTLELSQAIRPDELGAMAVRIGNLIRREVTDPAARERIAVELERMMATPEAIN